MVMPLVWQCLCNYLALDDRQRRVLWGALTEAKWSVAASWRQRLLLFEAQPGKTLDAVMAFWRRQVSPQEVVDVLEALVAERRLPRRTVGPIEERVFARLLPDGRWQ